MREFEEAVDGAEVRYNLAVDIVMGHALKTGQWTKEVKFRDLTGRDAPLLVDSRPRPRPEMDPEEREHRAEAEAVLAAHEEQMRAKGLL